MSTKVNLVDPKWIASLYALLVSVFCILFFTYSDVDFFTALIKTFFTIIAFYILGIVTASFINFVLVNFSSKEEDECIQSEEGDLSEQESQSQQEAIQTNQANQQT